MPEKLDKLRLIIGYEEAVYFSGITWMEFYDKTDEKIKDIH